MQSFRFAKTNIELFMLNLIVALTYICTGLLSQQFAIPPGNISPIWIPSGVMFALVVKYGFKIKYGIFWGAFLGNVWAYFTLDNASRALIAAICNGFGDVIAIATMCLLIQRFTKSKSPFERIEHFVIFLILGVIIGPLISALFGVTSLAMLDFITSEKYFYSLLNWWIGDSVGVLLIAPLLSSFWNHKKSNIKPLNLTACLLVSTLTCAISFQLLSINSLLYKLIIAFSPAIFAFILLSGQLVVYLVQLSIVSIAIYATYQGLGPFYHTQIISPLVDLQMFIAILSMVIFVLALIVEQKRQVILELGKQKQELESLYRHDKLTNLWNRYGIEELINIDIVRASRTNQKFALLMVDIDDFKKVNDNYGHLEGDRVLFEIANLLSQNIRKGDLLGRWGGEEFIIILAHLETDQAELIANKLVKAVNSHCFHFDSAITISIGYTLYQQGDNIDSLICRADSALYLSKTKGKNQVNVNN